ncbi:MAG: protein kinase domain-containing protein [Gemmatimonadales bacterium]
MADLPRQLQDGLSGRYALERELGRGGMATVFLAQDLKHDRPVALKLLHPELAASLGPERFQREIRFAARLQHPHILTVLDSGETAGQLWFTMPYVEGESLRARLNRERQLPLEDALQITREAARALDHAHQHGIVHRDIKPENILLTKDGSTLVADFGIARALAGDERLTQTGMAVGTPTYMSPEQASGDTGVDARTDVYSLGAVLFELLSGEPPYTGATAQQIIVKRFTDPVPSVRRARPIVPETVDQAIQRALAPIPADRFATPGLFAQALGGGYAGTRTGGPAPAAELEPATVTVTSASQPAGAEPRRPIRLPLAALTLGLGFLIGLGVLFAWRRTHSAADPDSPGPKRIAVLPFENLGDSATEYFAEGVTDAVRGKLSALPGLQVIASRSSNEYKRSDKSLPVIGRELGTDYLVIARIRWAKAPDGTSRVEVSPELVDVSPGRTPTTKWQQPFEAAMTDVFRVQAEIASKVAASLDVALGAAQKQVLTERPTASLAAYEAFLKGEAATQSIGSFDAAGLRSGIGFYEKAVALDSTFAQAWAQLSRAQAAYYFNVTPTPAAADGARRAAERAAALAPGRPEAQLALGDYYNAIRGSNAEALAAYEAGLKAAPSSAELLTGSALAEQSLGRWEAAHAHLERAAQLDPRSVATARRLGLTLIRLHRYPEALAAAERGVRLAPTGLSLIQNLAMVHLGRGDLDGTRAVLQAVPPEVEPTALVAFMGTYWDLFWVLDDAQQQLLLRLPPSAFADDRGNWGIVLAQTHYLRGDRARARLYADSARAVFLEQLAATPNDAQRHSLVGLALAYMGRKADAIREGERAVALTDPARDGFTGPYLQHLLVRIYLLVGEPEKALDYLEPLLRLPYHLSPGWLRIDPAFAPLRGNPRFEKLTAGS